MKMPPFMIHPGSNPVSVSKFISTSLVPFSNNVSVSLGRNLHTQPAVCHVVPDVSLALSNRTALIPRFVSWNSVWQPAVPPPILIQNIYLKCVLSSQIKASWKIFRYYKFILYYIWFLYGWNNLILNNNYLFIIINWKNHSSILLLKWKRNNPCLGQCLNLDF